MLGSVFIALVLRVGGTALWLLFSVVVARALSLEDFGFVFFAINVIMIGGAISVMGYDVTVLRFGSILWRDQKKQEFRNLLAEARQAVFIMGLIVSVGLALATLLGLDTPVTNDLPIALLVGASILAIGFMSVERDVLRAAGKLQQALFAFSIIRSLVPLVLIAVAWPFGILTTNFVLIAVGIALLSSLAWDRWCLHKLALPKREMIALPHLRIALITWSGDAGLVVLLRAPAIVIGLTGGLGAAALFIAAERISQLGTFFTEAVRTAVGPNLAQANENERQKAVTHASMLMLVSGLIGSILLLVFGAIFLWLFGPAYRPAFPALIALLIGQTSWAILGPTALVLNMFGEAKVRSLISVLAAIGLLILLPLFDTALAAAIVVAAISWAMNFGLCLAIYIRLGLRCGVFGIGMSDAKNIWKSEMKTVLKFTQGHREV